MQSLLGNIYKAKGGDLDFKIGLGLTPLLFCAVLIGSQYGTAGVAIGILLFNVALLASTYRALQLIELDPFKTLAALLPETIAALFMGAGLLALDALHAIPRTTVAIALIVQVAIGVVLFFAALLLISRRTVLDLWAVRRFLRTRR